jgi:D-alanine-D-alanine ligase
MYDLSTDLVQLIDDKDNIDFVRVMIHGAGWEDGQIIGLLDLLGLRYQCANREVLTVTMNKYLTKQLWKSDKLPVARDMLMHRTMTHDQIHGVIASFNYHCVVKAIGEGSSKWLIIVTWPNQLDEVVQLVQEYDRVLCEEFISGTEITVAVLDREVLPVVEIIPPEGQSFDFENKYNGKTAEICPARISDELTMQVQELALKAYDIVGCTRYGRVDMILWTNWPVLLEINTIPWFTDQSLFPLAARTTGISFDELVYRLMR